MDFPSTPFGGSSIPSLSTAILYDLEQNLDDVLASLFIYDPRASPPAHDPTQADFLCPQLGPTKSSLAAEQSSSFTSATHAPPPLVDYSARNNALPSDFAPAMSSPISSTSESSAYGAGHTSGGDAVATRSQSVHPDDQEHKIRSIFPHMSLSELANGQTVPPSSEHPEHVILWHRICSDAVVVDGARKFVAQTIYQPHSQGDKERYVSLATLLPPIIFLAQDSPEWGISIQRLLSRQSVQLVDGSKPAFTSCGTSVGIRIQWPGYQPYHKQVATRDYTPRRCMITKEKLAKVVAKCIRNFMDTMSERAMEVGSDRQWKIGPLGIRVEDIILVSLHHVSQGSWQPQLRLRRTIGGLVTAGSSSVLILE